MKFPMNHTIPTVLLVLLAGLTLQTAAQQQKVVVDYHTNVERLFNLEDGMTLSQVNETLETVPYDLVQNTEGGYLILEYRYVKAYRSIGASEADTESGRLEGVPYYQDASSVYLLFSNDNRLVSYVTADAMGDLEHQYKLEATARKLASMDAPCTRNCRIAIPGTEVVQAGDEEQEVRSVEAESEPTVLGSLFGNKRERTASRPVVSEPAASRPVVEAADAGPKYVQGDKVWLTVSGLRLKGVVKEVVGSRGAKVQYVHPVTGINSVIRAHSDLEARE